MFNLIIAILSLIIQVLVVYYGYRMYRILNPVRYWSSSWLLYSVANLLILFRRIIGVIYDYQMLSININFSWSWLIYEKLLQVGVSILLLIFVMKLKKLYRKYFENGLDIKAWKQEQQK